MHYFHILITPFWNFLLHNLIFCSSLLKKFQNHTSHLRRLHLLKLFQNSTTLLILNRKKFYTCMFIVNKLLSKLHPRIQERNMYWVHQNDLRFFGPPSCPRRSAEDQEKSAFCCSPPHSNKLLPSRSYHSLYSLSHNICNPISVLSRKLYPASTAASRFTAREKHF